MQQPCSRHLYLSEEAKKNKWKLFLHILWQTYTKSIIKRTLFPEPGNERVVLSLHVLGGVGKEMRVLRGRIFRAVGSGVADHHQHGPVRIHLLGDPEERDAVIGNQIRQVIL